MHKWSLVLTLFEKSYVKWMIAYILSLRKLETILAETVVGRLNGESLTPWLSFISNAARLSLKLLLSAGRSISSKKWLRDLFFNEDSNIHQWFSIHNLWFNTFWVKKELLHKFTFCKANIFSLSDFTYF